MAVASMTGYARAEGQHGPLAWSWEIKSVNGRGLDVRVRTPAGWEALELPARELIGRRVHRGSVAASLTVKSTGTEAKLAVNTALAERVAAILRDWQRQFPDFGPPRIDALLAVRGVLEEVESDDSPESREAQRSALLDGLSRALEALEDMRRLEGERLCAVLNQRLDEVAALVEKAEAAAAVRPEALRERLRAQVQALLEAGNLPEERLAQEAALLATRLDVREELDRLKAHTAAARDLLAAGGPIGRSLDFLGQEFNREANTVCSKSGDIDLTRLGLELKAVIDQFREQVQNIE